MKILIDEKTKKEIVYESRRKYQDGVASLCACYPDNATEAEGFVIVEASRNFSSFDPDFHILSWIEMTADDLIDTDIPGHPEICSFWDGSAAESEWDEMKNSDLSQDQIETFIQKYEGKRGELYTSDDVDAEVWHRIYEELWSNGYELEVIPEGVSPIFLQSESSMNNDIVVIQKCNECGRFETPNELREGAAWVEGIVESGLSQEEKNEAKEILNFAFETEKFEATEDDSEDPNWDVCYNVCPECVKEEGNRTLPLRKIKEEK